MKIVLISVDTLRFDHLGCYGYERDTSPNIDRLAASGVLFERSYPTDVPTQPSYTSILTGQRGIANGVVTHAPHEWLDPRSPWLPGLLESNRYLTTGVSTLAQMKAYFAKGFNCWMDPVAGRRGLLQRVTADQVNSFALPWIRDHSDQDFFMFIHYWDPHEYRPPEEYRRLFYQGDERDPENRSLDEARGSTVWPFLKRKLEYSEPGVTDAEYFRAQYDGAIRYVDGRIGELLDCVEEEGIKDESLLIFTSDHGESLGEHSIFFDHAGIYEDTVHVPLVVRWEGSKVDRSKALVQHVDLAPTILELAGIERPEGMQGQSLVPLLEGQSDCLRDTAYVNQGAWQAKRAMLRDDWKYIYCIHHGFWPCPSEELYRISEDPAEQRNLSEQKPAIRDRLALELRRWEEKQLGRRKDPLRVAAERGLETTKWVWSAGYRDDFTYEEWSRRMGW